MLKRCTAAIYLRSEINFVLIMCIIGPIIAKIPYGKQSIVILNYNFSKKIKYDLIKYIFKIQCLIKYSFYTMFFNLSF